MSKRKQRQLLGMNLTRKQAEELAEKTNSEIEGYGEYYMVWRIKK